MQRARMSVLVRKHDPSQLRTLTVGDPGAWPLHLKLAWAILHHDLMLPAPAARELIASCIKAAQECATRMNKRIQQSEVSERARKVQQAFQRLSHCAKRSPATLRQLLDDRFRGLLHNVQVDLETIASLLALSREAFEQFPESEGAQTSLSALGVYREHGYDIIGLSTDRCRRFYKRAARRRCH